jgi:hypothetical protein
MSRGTFIPISTPKVEKLLLLKLAKEELLFSKLKEGESSLPEQGKSYYYQKKKNLITRTRRIIITRARSTIIM